MEELDAPGEWCYDRRSGRIALYPPDGFSADSLVALGVSGDSFFRVCGSDIAIEGFTFTAKHSHPAVILEGGERNVLAGCRFSGLEYEPVFMSGRDCRVQSCDFTELNAAGVRFCGGNAAIGDRGGNVVENCRVYDCSYQFGDTGAVYSHGGSRSFGCTFRYNDISAAPGFVNCIYYDDTTSGHRIYGNVCRGYGCYGIFLGGGRDNLVSNNVVIDVGGEFLAAQQAKGIRVQPGEYVSEGNLAVRTAGKTGPNDRRGVWYLGGVRVLDGTKEEPIDLGFVDVPPLERKTNRRYAWRKGDFNLKKGAKVLEACPDFRPIPWDRIGLYRDKWRTDPTLPEKPAPEG